MRPLLVLTALAAMLAAALWWGVPALLRTQLPPRLSDALGRTVSLADARFDPLRMAVDLRGLRVGGPAADAPPLLEIDRLQADLGLWQTLRHRAPVLEALAIDGLRGRVARTAPGRYDIDDLLARLARPAAPAAPQPGPARFALYNLSLRDASLHFDDRPVARVHAVQGLTVTLPFLSNLPGDVEIRTEPRLAFRLNGTAFDSGSQSLPFAATRRGTLQLAFADLDIAPWLPYLPTGLPLQLQRGRLDSRLDLQFSLPPQGAPTMVLQGRIGLRDLAVAEPDGTSLAAWRALAVELRDVQPLARRVALGSLTVDGLAMDLHRDAQGRLNLQRLAAAGPQTAATPAAAAASVAVAAEAAPGWTLELDGLQLRDGTLRWTDDALRPTAVYTLAGLSLDAGTLRWPGPPPVPVRLAATLHGGGADGPVAAVLAAEGQADDRAAQLALTLDAPDLATLAPYLATALKPRLSGRAGLKSQLHWAAEPAALDITIDEAWLQDLQLRDGPGRGAPLLAGLKRLQADGVRLDVLARRASIARLRIDRPDATLARAGDGGIDLSAWLPSAAATAVPADRRPIAQAVQAAAGRRGAAPARRPAPAPAWQLHLQDLGVTGGRLAWSDAAAATAGQPLQAELHDLKLRLQGLSWPAPTDRRALQPRLQISAGMGAPAQAGGPAQQGRIAWDGRFGLAPLQADGRLTLTRLPLHLFVPYAGDALPAAVLHADASLDVQLRARSGPAGWAVSTDGDMQVTEVMVHTRPGPGEQAGSELLSWQSLALQGVSATLTPDARPRLVVRELALDDFYSRLVITEQGRFNLQDVAAPAPGGSAVAAAPAVSASASAAVVAPAAPDAGLPMDLELGQTTLRNGRVDFSDRFVRPNYSARLTELNGSIGAIRSGTREMASIGLRGRAADTALLDIAGQINPTAQPLALDIRARATDLELAPLSPYAGKYAGYAIERGKLSMDVSYRIDADGRLEAKNQVILNQLTFGDRVESPSATQLPVLLAVALLRDRNGVIDINLPVNGTLGDPQFSVGGIIVKVIVNLLTKALTAPFALLAGGGADDLSQVQFAPGTARITDGGRLALDKVARALAERPGLTMTVTGAADTVSERDDARRSLLDERLAAELRRARQRALPASGAASAAGAGPGGAADHLASAPDMAPPGPAERAAALRRLYQQTPLPDRPRNLLNQLKELAPDEMEARLLAGVAVTDDTMRELALQRGLAVRDALIGAGLPSERLFLAAPRLRLSGEGDAAWSPSVQLTLSSR